MKYLIAISSVISCIALLAEGTVPAEAAPPVRQSASAWFSQTEPPIKISAKYRWFRIVNKPPQEFNTGLQRVKMPGLAMLDHSITVPFDRGTYDKDKVTLVTELEYIDKDNKVVSYRMGIEAAVKTPTGEVSTVWALSGKS